VTYYILVYGNSTSAGEFEMNVIDIPVQQATVTPSATDFCPGDTVTLSANTAAGYLWNDVGMSTTQDIDITVAGSYFVVGTDTNGCIDTSAAVAATVEGKTIVMTTTNGTRALQACRNAQRVLVASFLNLRATAHWIKEHQPDRLLLVCSGTEDQPALEDVLAAGALCEKIWALYSHGQISDAAEMARRIFPLMQSNLAEAMKSCRNGRRLLGMPDLQDDVLYCVQRETVDIVACMDRDGVVKILS
jgi:phosphosulfolactate phosphohydrolase-like enzyme